MSDDYIECPDCHATPYNRDERVITGNPAGAPTTTYHTKDCPKYGGRREGAGGEEGPRLRLVRPDEEPTP
jgi:hypothetical protein